MGVVYSLERSTADAAMREAGFCDCRIIDREDLVRDFVETSGADGPFSDRFMLAVATR